MIIDTLHDVLAQDHVLWAFCRHPTCRAGQKVDVDRLVQRTGPSQTLVPRRSESHFTDRMRCPACKRRGMNLWIDPQPSKLRVSAPVKAEVEPNYRVIDHGDTYPYLQNRTIATADNLMVARGAYVAAALFYPKRSIVLRQGAFVIANSKEGPPPKPMTADDFKAMSEAEMGLAGVTGLPEVATDL